MSEPVENALAFRRIGGSPAPMIGLSTGKMK
jgi:hypothetical protein